MAKVKDYTTGKVLTNAKLSLLLLNFVKIPIIGFLIGRILLKGTGKYEPKLIDMEAASKLIQNSEKCAAGERICRAIHPESEFTETVFLDELAEGLMKAGKARYMEKEEAINTLKKYPDNPLILSKISGKYIELCRSSPGVCVYWNMERCGLRCLE